MPSLTVQCLFQHDHLQSYLRYLLCWENLFHSFFSFSYFYIAEQSQPSSSVRNKTTFPSCYSYSSFIQLLTHHSSTSFTKPAVPPAFPFFSRIITRLNSSTVMSSPSHLLIFQVYNRNASTPTPSPHINFTPRVKAILFWQILIFHKKHSDICSPPFDITCSPQNFLFSCFPIPMIYFHYAIISFTQGYVFLTLCFPIIINFWKTQFLRKKNFLYVYQLSLLSWLYGTVPLFPQQFLRRPQVSVEASTGAFLTFLLALWPSSRGRRPPKPS